MQSFNYIIPFRLPDYFEDVQETTIEECRNDNVKKFPNLENTSVKNKLCCSIL